MSKDQKDWMKIAKENVARAAMQAMMADQQGNAIFDDGLLDATDARQDDMNQVKIALERVLMDLGIEPDDPDLIEWVIQANAEIKEYKKEEEGNGN